mmetsp:Transcript_10064/g.33640  ORF Transcript_10064/g.33640 Transcript_10064/m.33640 type:complete len:284 (+) Transcript_10064:583-1434(+)
MRRRKRPVTRRLTKMPLCSSHRCAAIFARASAERARSTLAVSARPAASASSARHASLIATMLAIPPHVVHLHQPVASLVVGNREEVPVVHRAVVKPALVARGLHVVSAQRGHVEGREGALLEEPAGPVEQVVQEQLHKPQVAVPSVHLEQHLRADGRLRVRTLSRGRVAVRHEPLRRLGLHRLDEDGIAELLARRVEAQHVGRKVRVPIEEYVRPILAQHGGVPAPRVTADDGGDDALQRVVDHVPHDARLHRHLDLRMLAVCAVARLLRLPRRAERRPDPSG